MAGHMIKLEIKQVCLNLSLCIQPACHIYIGSSIPDKCVVNTWANGSKNNAIRSKKGLGGYDRGFPGVSFILSFSLPIPSQVILNWFLFSCKSHLTVYSSCLMWQFNPFLNATMLLLECPWTTILGGVHFVAMAGKMELFIEIHGDIFRQASSLFLMWKELIIYRADVTCILLPVLSACQIPE